MTSTGCTDSDRLPSGPAVVLVSGGVEPVPAEGLEPPTP